MKKYVLDFKLVENIRLHPNYVLMKYTTTTGDILPEMYPGQFAEIRVDDSPTTFLRRPISINFVDKIKNEFWILVQLIGDGTRSLAAKPVGTIINMILPLGNTFSTPSDKKEKILLVGGGVGTAPMLYLGYSLKESGYTPTFLLGARSKQDIMQLDDFKSIGDVYITTEDGSLGEKGYVTQHPILEEIAFDRIYTCGPKPMMVAVASYAKKKQAECEVSLENWMACGVGACLCCVEKTVEGHVCVCSEGPVFNIKQLTWQI